MAVPETSVIISILSNQFMQLSIEIFLFIPTIYLIEKNLFLSYVLGIVIMLMFLLVPDLAYHSNYDEQIGTPIFRQTKRPIQMMWIMLLIPSQLVQNSIPKLLSSLRWKNSRVTVLAIISAAFIEGSFCKYQYFNYLLSEGKNYTAFYLDQIAFWFIRN